MQALGLFSRRAILGRSNKNTVVLEKIAKANSLNRTGAVNFNKYGKQDGVGFSPCSDKFVDNFLLYVLVPDYFATAKKTYTEVGHVNKHIRDMLTRFGFGKCEVKAVALSPLKEQPKADELDKVYGYEGLKLKRLTKLCTTYKSLRSLVQTNNIPMFSSS